MRNDRARLGQGDRDPFADREHGLLAGRNTLYVMAIDGTARRWEQRLQVATQTARRAAGPARRVFRDYAQGAWKPIFLCVPSQNGFCAEWPQRQNQVFSTRSTLRPVPDSTSSLPVTISGPLTTGCTST